MPFPKLYWSFSWISLLYFFRLLTCRAQRWCTNLAMVGKWRICLRPSRHVEGALDTLKFSEVFFCLPRLSLIDAAVEVRSQVRSKSVGKTPKILGWQDMARPNKHMVKRYPIAFSCMCAHCQVFWVAKLEVPKSQSS